MVVTRISEDDEQGIEDSSRIFTTPARTLLGGARAGRPSFLRYFRRLRPFVLIGRDITTDTQTLDNIINAAGRLRVDAGLGSGAVVTSPASFLSLAIGESAWAMTGSVAGNVAATLPTLASNFGESIFEILQILHVLDDDATVASRIPTLTIVTGMPSIVTTLDDWSQVGATATQNENAKLFIPRGPATAKINDNGTITDGATSPLPMFIGDAGVISVAVASGVAGDAHSLACLVRRIA
jgi:hypothetical protein